MHKEGLKNEALTRACLAGLTAGRLLENFRTVISEMRRENSDDARILGSVSERAKSLIKQRNEVMHSTLFIGWESAENEDFSRAKYEWFKRDKDGIKLEAREGTVEQSNRLSEEAGQLTRVALSMAVCLDGDMPFSERLSIDKNGTVRPRR